MRSSNRACLLFIVATPAASLYLPVAASRHRAPGRTPVRSRTAVLRDAARGGAAAQVRTDPPREHDSEGATTVGGGAASLDLRDS